MLYKMNLTFVCHCTNVLHVSLGNLNHLPELTTLVHFNHNITTTDELAGDIQLGNGGPLRKVLDALSDALIGKDVDGFEINSEALQDLNSRVGETALREDFASLHEEKDGMGIDQRLDALLGALRVETINKEKHVR